MNSCTNYCDGKQLLQRHPLRNPPLLRTPKNCHPHPPPPKPSIPRPPKLATADLSILLCTRIQSPRRRGRVFWGILEGLLRGWRFMKTRGFRVLNPGFRNLRVFCRFSAVFCENPAKICGFLRKSAFPKCFVFQESLRKSAKISENLRKCSVCPLRLSP